MFVLLDNCPPSYGDLFKKYFDEHDLELIRLNGVGNRATFDMQVNILLDQDFSEIVYFAEDDYLYLPNQFESIVKFLREEKHVDFVSPYDHLDYYMFDPHNQKHFIKFFDEKHWRTAASTCSTFLTTKTKLEKTQNVFRSYTKKNDDVSLWISLTKQRLVNPPCNAAVQAIKWAPLWNHFARVAFLLERNLIWQTVELVDSYSGVAIHLESDHLAHNFNWVTTYRNTTSERDKYACDNGCVPDAILKSKTSQ